METLQIMIQLPPDNQSKLLLQSQLKKRNAGMASCWLRIPAVIVEQRCRRQAVA
jgi:hypothetical protein